MTGDTEPSNKTEPLQCEYKFRDQYGVKGKGEQCAEDAHSDGKCILHINFPANKDSPEYEDIAAKKAEKIREKAEKDDFYFEGAILPAIDFSERSVLGFVFVDATIGGVASFTGATFKGRAWFLQAIFEGDALFDSATFEGRVWFTGATFKENASFERVTFQEDVLFDEATIKWDAFFQRASINGTADFRRADIAGRASFGETTIGRDVWFVEARVAGDILFYKAIIDGSVIFDDAALDGKIWFDEARIRGDVWFRYARIGGYLSIPSKGAQKSEVGGEINFRETRFLNLTAEEQACRQAKEYWKDQGDREQESYYSYREMDARRRAKVWYARYPELMFKYYFGYGVSSHVVLRSFLLTMFLFAGFYWVFGALLTIGELLMCLRFSFLTIWIPAYGIESAKPAMSIQTIAFIEAIIGAFLWPALIAVIGRRYLGG